MQGEVVGSIYCECSKNFQRGVFPIARTLKAEHHDLAVVLRGGTDMSTDAEVKVIGQMDNSIDHTFESANRVYDSNGLAPTIPTCGGGGYSTENSCKGA